MVGTRSKNRRKPDKELKEESEDEHVHSYPPFNNKNNQEMSREELAVQRAREAFRSGKTRPLEFRKQQLKNLLRFFTERKAEIADSVKRDLGKSERGTELFEILGCEGEVHLALEQLSEWAAPRPVEKTLLTLSDQAYVRPEPLGVVLIIGAWNYPWAVTLQPLVGAIAAGNAAIIKPSEVSSNTAKTMEELLPQYLDKDLFPVVSGGVSETQELLRQRFDHIFYTGSSSVGRLVMEAAAVHLTPVTLELGGKSPCYVDRNCDLAVACRRITWGKFVNCGQTCIAPDYVLCEPSVQSRVVDEMRKCIKEFYTEQPLHFEDYGRIINHRHFDRIVGLMEGGCVALGGDCDKKNNYIAPTVLQDVSADSKVMQEEIFGPAIQFINDREKPLVIYVFSNDKKWDGLLQRKHTFDRLSHLRSCLIKSLRMESVNSMRYPPHTQRKMSWARLLMLKISLKTIRRVTLAGMLVGLATFVIQRFLLKPNQSRV
ncbi:hypothetical protein WMY93_028392 [Mugilogobius chulae]|uniref:Aldehyde dehydrogenase n=1 Tax=Mugilogobius chulae TaxID=88201 RepID=A0AAW0MNA5_9GOBI